jgi:RNA polymerase sigma-70 factor (ECF subfamily)
MMGESDAAVVTRVRTGDRDAYRVLVERHSRRIFHLAYRMTGSEQDAEDLVQETFMRAFQQLDGFTARSQFGTWIYRIAVNCAIDIMRKHQRRDEPFEPIDPESGIPLVADTPGPDRLVFSGEMQQRVKSALDQLSPMERAAFVLRHYEGKCIEEISDTLGLANGATKQAVFRAVQKIRRSLQPLVDSAKWSI